MINPYYNRNEDFVKAFKREMYLHRHNIMVEDARTVRDIAKCAYDVKFIELMNLPLQSILGAQMDELETLFLNLQKVQQQFDYELNALWKAPE